jgi:hypothetical protein
MANKPFMASFRATITVYPPTDPKFSTEVVCLIPQTQGASAKPIYLETSIAQHYFYDQSAVQNQDGFGQTNVNTGNNWTARLPINQLLSPEPSSVVPSPIMWQPR